MMRIGICDDDIQFCRELDTRLDQYCHAHFLQKETMFFTSGQELLEYLDANGEMDLLFLDIRLTDTDGIQIGKLLRQSDRTSMQIIFVSSYTCYAMQLFQIHPLDFLIKPFSQKELDRVMDTYLRLFPQDHVFFQYTSGKQAHQVAEHSILYLQSIGRTIHMTTLYGTNIFYDKLSDCMKRLQSGYFFNVHKSYIINLNYVLEYLPTEIIMTNHAHIPISQSKKSQVRAFLLQNNIKKSNRKAKQGITL